MSIRPVWLSVAESARFTLCDCVDASPLLMDTESPVGADVSRYRV